MDFINRNMDRISLGVVTIIGILFVWWTFTITEIPETQAGIFADDTATSEIQGDKRVTDQVTVSLKGMESDPVDPQFTCARMVMENTIDEVILVNNDHIGLFNASGDQMNIILGASSLPRTMETGIPHDISVCFDILMEDTPGSTLVFRFTEDGDAVEWVIS